MKTQRTSGILLHPTSLPSEWGVGDFGPAAYEFIDFLHTSGQCIWQMLPLGPTGYGDSPYQTLSAFAGNPMLISPDVMVEEGLLHDVDIVKPAFPDEYVDFADVIPFKYELLKKAYNNFLADKPAAIVKRYRQFCTKHAHWLDDFCLFAALKGYHQGKPWTRWPRELVQRNPKALSIWSQKLENEIGRNRFNQFLFFDQWTKLHSYANSHGIRIIGDLPIFVAHDSSDVWSHQEWFYLDKLGTPTVVAGVPPDYFSETGQRWGNPLFNWNQLKQEGFSFWIKRFEMLSFMFDYIRIDHFRGFASYWEIPADEKTAINGTWKKGPGAELFLAIEREIGNDVPIIAEDLGVITPDVTEMLDELGFPGMAILQFGFEAVEEGLNSSAFLPHNHLRNQVVYTGTHDNDTVRGWWDKQPEEVRDFTRRYLNTDGTVIHRDMIRTALASVAALAIFPLQDLFGLGNEGRMNLPGRSDGNWQWRFAKQDLSSDLADDLLQMTRLYERMVTEKTTD
ncbi:MAG: 4-alpha-glucanotransferase [Thermodesulfobacteriota bacterium]|nr:4-alpha-glucanotransferase [Thermodesulfobacteriota bacterium]